LCGAYTKVFGAIQTPGRLAPDRRLMRTEDRSFAQTIVTRSDLPTPEHHEASGLHALSRIDPPEVDSRAEVAAVVTGARDREFVEPGRSFAIVHDAPYAPPREIENLHAQRSRL